MSQSDIAFLAVAVLAFICVAVVIYRKQAKPCEKCGGKMRLKSLEDPMGIKVKRKMTISLYVGPRKYKETWKCESCGEEKVVSYWGG